MTAPASPLSLLPICPCSPVVPALQLRPPYGPVAAPVDPNGPFYSTLGTVLFYHLTVILLTFKNLSTNK